MTARRRNASATGAGSRAPSVAAIAASYEAMASEMRAARSCARAWYSRSAAGRPKPVSKGLIFSGAGMATSPSDGVVGEVVQSPGHVIREEVIQRHHVTEDGQRIVRVRDPFRQDLPEQVAIRVAHRERGSPLEHEALVLEANPVHVVRRSRRRDT